MWFFIQRGVVELEYLVSEREDKEGKSNDYTGLFAFFVANFRYTRAEFDELTKKELLYILKAWENKIVLETQLQANAFSNAYVNANRKKGASATPLWSKKRNNKVNIELMKNKFKEISEAEANNTTDWIRLIYGGN